MIREARNGGASLAKFQLYNAEDDRGKPHYDWVKDHELNFDQAKMLFEYGKSNNIEVFFSVFGVKYVDWGERIGVKRYKISAGDWQNKILMNVVGGVHKPVIQSLPYGKSSYPCPKPSAETILYCVPEYPTPLSHLKFPDFNSVWDGFSDHTIGLDAAKIALARGARIIEKHFCLEHNPDFPDDKWSMDVNDLKELVRWEKICREVL